MIHMKYASSIMHDGVETIVVVLPLSAVPFFDPENPPQPNTYAVADAVDVGWIKDASGRWVPPSEPPPPSPADLVARYEALLDQHLDAVAQKYRYADRTRLALRAGYPNEHQPLALAFGTWMDQSCNRPAKQLMVDVIAGKKPMPSEDEFIAGLPPFVPPVGY